jgi:uncharacterized repeat protein (TIGR03803 family)
MLHSFGSSPNGSDGANPSSSLIVDASGAWYGTTQNGGSGYGVIFKFARTLVAGHYTYPETVLYTFTGGADGAHPIGGLVADGTGAFYGTTSSGGNTGAGVVFRLTPPAPGQSRWAETVLHTFGSLPGSIDGATPKAGLLWNGGAVYGTTENGGSAGLGVAFELSPSGSGWVETVLHSFGTSPNYTDGANPTGGLIADKYGVLYGTTQGGGIGRGVLFQLAPTGSSWTETVLHTFGTAPGASDGGNPADTLMFSLGNAGPIYGTTLTGGTGNSGVAFELSFANGVWTETVLHAFCTSPGCADGATPMSGLTIVDNTLLGTTFYGGLEGSGVIYDFSLGDGIFFVNAAFNTGRNEYTTNDGANPLSGLLYSANSFWGTTEYGGSGYGTFYCYCDI